MKIKIFLLRTHVILILQKIQMLHFTKMLGMTSSFGLSLGLRPNAVIFTMKLNSLAILNIKTQLSWLLL